jgi:hypothetical protein
VVLHDLTAVLQERAAKEETAQTIITAPPSVEVFREQRKRSASLQTKPTKETKPTISNTGVNDPQIAVEA